MLEFSRMGNQHEDAARARKAQKLHDTIVRKGWNHMLDILGDAHWQVIAKEAGVNMPSPETRKMVIDGLRGGPSPAAR